MIKGAGTINVLPAPLAYSEIAVWDYFAIASCALVLYGRNYGTYP